jgi:hypothetical protein
MRYLPQAACFCVTRVNNGGGDRVYSRADVNRVRLGCNRSSRAPEEHAQRDIGGNRAAELVCD